MSAFSAGDSPKAFMKGLDSARPWRSLALIAFTCRGCNLAKHLALQLGAGKAEGAEGVEDGAAVSIAGPARYADELGIEPYESLAAWTAEHFGHDDALVYVGATGIAVRAIAPHVRDKFSDPAVVSVDEAGMFAVPLLSGHVGGANDLARAVAAVTGGQAVVSTATDVNGLFAVDEWAARNNLAIVERSVAKQVSAALLEGKTVGFYTDEPLDWDVPAGVTPVDVCSPRGCTNSARNDDDTTLPGVVREGAGNSSGSSGEAMRFGKLGFAVSLDDTIEPFDVTLHLVPRIVTVGVGCRRGCDPAVLERAVGNALRLARVSAHAVARVASIDVKSDEPAIRQLAARRGWELRFYTADELAAVPGDFTASDFVKRTVGVDNVCERAALHDGGTLLLGKQAHEGTTVALARL